MEKALKERIDRIHENYIIVDGHFDLLMDVLAKRELGYKKVIENDHLKDFIEGGVNIVVCSIYIDDMFLPEMALRRALDQISALQEEIEESKDKIMLCKSYEDIMKAVEEKKIGFLLSFEGVEPIGNDLKLLRIFYELGVRIVGLVWSRRNYAADGCHFSKKEEGKKGGLTNFGVELVREAEKLGMFIDVSHLNDEGFWDVIDIAKKPVIASHSNCRALTNTMRNLEDKQIMALASKGGILGMNVCSSFVSDKDENCDAEHLADHVDHIVKVAGIENVGLGFDFCDFMREDAPKRAEKPRRRSFDVIKGHKNIKDFTKALINHGYSDEEIGMVLGGNFLRLYKKLL